MTPVYRAVRLLTTPIVRWWGRLEVVGADLLPESGPTLVIGNHDSYWDPIAVAVAAPHRQIHALAKSTLWKGPLGWILDGMGQIPIQRGKGDAAAMATAIERLREGTCIGVFPEGTMSRGRTLRARSGAGRLAEAVPDATVVAIAITGTVDIVRFPKRPRIRVEFFLPEGGGWREGTDTPGSFSARLLAETRARAPIAIPGRRRTAAKYRARQAAEAGRSAAPADAPAPDPAGSGADRA